MKIFETIDYNNLVTSYNSYVDSRKKFQKILRDIEPLTIFIYKTIWEEFGSDFLEHDIEGDIEDLSGNWDDLSLNDVSDVDDDGVILYYTFEETHKYGDSDMISYYLELSKEQLKHYEDRFEMSKETNKFNL